VPVLTFVDLIASINTIDFIVSILAKPGAPRPRRVDYIDGADFNVSKIDTHERACSKSRAHSRISGRAESIRR
jgi:hypothetical protein